MFYVWQRVLAVTQLPHQLGCRVKGMDRFVFDAIQQDFVAQIALNQVSLTQRFGVIVIIHRRAVLPSMAGDRCNRSKPMLGFLIHDHSAEHRSVILCGYGYAVSHMRNSSLKLECTQFRM